MNITEALNQVLPEIPARIVSRHYPRLHPDVVFKEHLQQGEPVVRVFVPDVEAMYSFTPQNWELTRLFNGQRSYEEVAELYARACGTHYGADQVREMADNLESIDFWYKTPQEKNVSLMQKTAEDRRKLLKQKKRKWGISPL